MRSFHNARLFDKCRTSPTVRFRESKLIFTPEFQVSTRWRTRSNIQTKKYPLIFDFDPLIAFHWSNNAGEEKFEGNKTELTSPAAVGTRGVNKWDYSTRIVRPLVNELTKRAVLLQMHSATQQTFTHESTKSASHIRETLILTWKAINNNI